MTGGDRRIRIAVLMGGPSSEREISLRSGRAVLDALDRSRFDAVGITLEPDGRWSLPFLPRGLLDVTSGGPTVPASEESSPGSMSVAGPGGIGTPTGSVDCFLLALHGKFGEDGTLQGVLEAAGVPYTGSGVMASALCMDKDRARAVVAAAGLSVAPGRAVDEAPWRRNRDAVLDVLEEMPGFPAFVKPAGGGSSIGAGPADDRATLAERIEEIFTVHRDRALVERRVVGRELSCPVMGNSHGEARALPVVEIVPRGRPFFDFTAKYDAESCDEICPARITAEEERRIRSAAVTAHRALGCDGMSRSDFILDGSTAWYLETNTIPGMTAESLCPRSARAEGLSFPALVTGLVELALERNAHRRRSKEE